MLKMRRPSIDSLVDLTARSSSKFIISNQLIKVDLTELLAVCYAEERSSRGRAALALRRRLGNELWAEQQRWEEAEGRAAASAAASDAAGTRLVYHKLTYWSTCSEDDAPGSSVLVPSILGRP